MLKNLAPLTTVRTFTSLEETQKIENMKNVPFVNRDFKVSNKGIIIFNIIQELENDVHFNKDEKMVYTYLYDTVRMAFPGLSHDEVGEVIAQLYNMGIIEVC